jgi:hypothetical protein
MVAGAPDVGSVSVFSNRSGVWDTQHTQQLVGEQPSSRFGAAVALNANGSVLVGAPGVFALNTNTPAGAAFFYQSTATGVLSQLGSPLQGDPTVYAANEEFGASVSMSSNNNRVVIGAPGSSVDLLTNRGRVYIFEYDSVTDWILLDDIQGASEGEALGSAVDMSASGNFIVVGSPGGKGFARIYQYNPFQWFDVARLPGQDTNEAFGSSVKFLTDDGSMVAVGGPGYDNGSGRVVVYRRDPNTNLYTQVGLAIVGGAGEGIGAPNRLVGSSTSVFVGTASGWIKRFDLNGTQWIATKTFVDTGYSSSSSSTGLWSIATTSNATTFVAGGNNMATIYELNAASV